MSKTNKTPKSNKTFINSITSNLVLSTMIFSSLIAIPSTIATQALSVVPYKANLIIGKVDTGSSIELSACLQNTGNPTRLTDSSLWLNFDNSQLSPSPTILQTGIFSGGNGYGSLKFQQVAPAPTVGQTSEKWTIATIFPGLGTEPESGGNFIPNTSELVAKVKFNKIGNTPNPIISVVKSQYFSVELGGAGAIPVNVINQNGDCRTLITPSSSSSSSSFNNSISSSSLSSISNNSAINSSSNTSSSLSLSSSSLADQDGVSETEENGSPNNGDGNGDGIKDGLQPNVASKSNPFNGNNYATLDAGTVGCSNISTFVFTQESSLGIQDTNFIYPIGLFDFKIKCVNPGQSVNVTLVLDKLYNTANWNYRLYNNITQTYSNVPNVTYGTKTIGAKNVTTINFQAQDGGPFDTDGIANGEYSDPSGPSINTSTGTVALTTVIGNPGSVFPTIPLIGGNIVNGITATFLPAGASTPIIGTIINNQFVPNSDQTISNNVTPGLNTGLLSIFTATPLFIQVPTNFGNFNSNNTSGGIITIPGTNNLSQNSSSSINESISKSTLVATTPTNTQDSQTSASSRESAIKDSIKDVIELTLPRTGGSTISNISLLVIFIVIGFLSISTKKKLIKK